MHALIQSLLDAYQQSLQTGGYGYIIFLMALESSVVPLPSELVIPPAIFLIARGGTSMTVTGVVLAAAVGSLLGASLMYWASRIAGRPIVMYWAARMEKWPVASWPFVARYARFLIITPEKVEGAERWSQRFGSFGIFLSRMLPVVRHLIGIPAGIVRMRFWKFCAYTFLGSLFWCAVLAYISKLAGHDERLMRGELREITLWLTGAALALGSAYYFLVHRYSRKAA